MAEGRPAGSGGGGERQVGEVNDRGPRRGKPSGRSAVEAPRPGRYQRQVRAVKYPWSPRGGWPTNRCLLARYLAAPHLAYERQVSGVTYPWRGGRPAWPGHINAR